MKNNDEFSHYEDELTVIWSIVEARRSLPTMIAVASASEWDGTSVIARGLASVAHAAGHRTGYLDLAGKSASAANTPYVSLATNANRQRDDFDRQVASWRSSLDVLIVDIPQLLSVRLGAHVARLSDGVIIGVRDGRRVGATDVELTNVLGELGASVLGVVRTSRQQIAQGHGAVPYRASSWNFGRMLRALVPRP